MRTNLLSLRGRLTTATTTCRAAVRWFRVTNSHNNYAILRVHGPDRKGIVAAVSQVLDRYGAAITQSEHWTDMRQRLFFQRVQFMNINYHHDSHNSDGEELCVVPFTEPQKQGIVADLQRGAAANLQHHVNWRVRKPRLAIFVSKYDHCLWELLLRHEAGELDCDICAVISNHRVCQHVADTFGIPFHVFPVTADTKQAVEERQLQLLQALQVDLVVLARYMQVLSTHFLQNFPYDRILNIHHSFLPAFAGEFFHIIYHIIDREYTW